MKSNCWYGRCLFLSWYCDKGTCKFCYRSTIKHKIKHPKKAKRSLASLIVETLLCKNLNWRIEFLTGGYKIYTPKELENILKLITSVYKEKIWINLGVIEKQDLELFKPYIKGIVSSIETTNTKLHSEICPDKPIKNYEEMFKNSKNLKKSITIIIGLGETKEDFKTLKEFIKKYKLNRITFYPLKPIKTTIYENKDGPPKKEYFWWIKQTRKEFPNLEIIAGTTARRYKEVPELIQAGANAFTKFPATKLFGSEQAKYIQKSLGKQLTSNLTKLPKINWKKQINELDSNLFSEEFKKEIYEKLKEYLERMR